MTESDGEKLNRLIIAVADGHADCLDGIYATAGRRMLAVALSVTGERSAAEDVVHDSLIKIARFAARYRRGTNAYGWILKIVRNCALDRLKAQKRRTEITETEFYNLSSDDYSPERRESAIMLEQAIAKLGEEERRVIYCVYWTDMTIRETAATLHISKSAAQRTLARAEKLLKSLISDGTKEE